MVVYVYIPVIVGNCTSVTGLEKDWMVAIPGLVSQSRMAEVTSQIPTAKPATTAKNQKILATMEVPPLDGDVYWMPWRVVWSA